MTVTLEPVHRAEFVVYPTKPAGREYLELTVDGIRLGHLITEAIRPLEAADHHRHGTPQPPNYDEILLARDLGMPLGPPTFDIGAGWPTRHMLGEPAEGFRLEHIRTAEGNYEQPAPGEVPVMSCGACGYWGCFAVLATIETTVLPLAAGLLAQLVRAVERAVGRAVERPDPDQLRAGELGFLSDPEAA